MNNQKEILELDDIRLLVDRFYDKVRADALLGGIFHAVIRDRWPEHLEKMYRFWQTILLDARTYHGSPFLPHAGLPVEHAHFERWLQLFFETVDMLFSGEKAEEAKWRAQKMADVFYHKIIYLRNNPVRPLI